MSTGRSEQVPFDYGHQPSHHEADFIEGQGNRLALLHVRAFPNWPGPLTLLEGPAKSGKSHLARVWQERADALSADPSTLSGFADVDLMRVRPLLIEDADRAGYPEPALFHVLNQSIRDRRPVLITAREPIANWPFETDDLKSRARLASRFTVAFSDDIQLTQMFVKLFSDRQVSVDPRVVAFLVARMDRSPEEAVALAEIADKLALSRGTAITRRIAAEALAQRGIAQGELDLEGDDDE